MKKFSRGRLLRVEPLEKKLMLNAGPLVISEFMAKNETTLLDADGDNPDWIEIHNPTTSPINLQGWHLTDDATDLDKWTFPDVTIDAGEYMVIFASDKDRTDPTAELHTNFKITTAGEYLGLIQPDETVAFAYSPAFPEQYADISYGGSPGEYYLTPTPGAENVSGSTIDSGIEFSHPSGVFSETFLLELTTDIPDAVIRYTRYSQYGEPTETSPIYTEPLEISNSSVIRAKVFSPVLPEGGILATASYIRVDSSLDTWDSNLPVIVLDARRVEPTQTSYVETIAAFFEPGASGRTTLSDTPTLNTLSGIKIRGSSSASFPKKQYSFEIWDGSSEDLDASLFGMPAESDWVLYAPYSDKSLMRNYLAYNWSDEMGDYAPGTVFCEVFLSTDDAVVGASDYVGVYVLVERIKIDENRVDIEEISGGTTENPDITGGVILKIDRPDDTDEYYFSSDYVPYYAVYKPELDELNDAEKAYVTNYIDEFETALYGTNFADPETGYAAYIDVGSFIDQMIMVEMTKNSDGYRLSSYFYFDDDTKLTAGPVWDYNLSLGNVNYNGGFDPTGWYYLADTSEHPFPVCPYYKRLLEDPNFEQQFADRWAELRGTILDTDVLLAQIDETAAYLAEAEVRDQAVWNTLGTYVWPNYYIGQTYADEINYMKEFLLQRLAWMDSQFLTAPVFSEEEGTIEPGTSLMITVPDTVASTIYYTTDGTDPRLSGGGISPNAQTVNGLQTTQLTLFEMGSTWYFNDTGTDLGTAWRELGYDYSTWSSGLGEFGYGDGDEATIVDYGGNASSKYPTTYFVKSVDVSDPDLIASLSIDLLRDDGAVVYLNGQEVVRSNMSTGTIDYGTLASLADDDGNTVYSYEIDKSLLVEGTNYIAVEIHQRTLDSSDLSFDLALYATSMTSEGIVLDETTEIVARRYADGQWSSPIQAVFVTHPELTPIISEIMYHPQDPTTAEIAAGFDNSDDFEFLEIYNPHAVSISLDGLAFTEGIGFDFTTDSAVRILQAGQRLVLVRNEEAFTLRYGTEVLLAGEYSDKLSNSGELLQLADAQGTVLQSIPYLDVSPWATEADGDGSSLVAAEGSANNGAESDPSYWFASEEFGGTPGWAGVVPVRTPGDANLDGRVDGSDVTILAGNWQVGVGGNGTATWAMGDFNGDGKVDGSDVTILAGNWQVGVSTTTVATSESEPESSDSFIAPVNSSLGIATVPLRSSLPPRRLITPTPELVDAALTKQESSQGFRALSSDDLTAIAKDLASATVRDSYRPQQIKRVLIANSLIE